MNETLDSLGRLLSDVILPNLKAVQVGQAEQIAANVRLEDSIEELRMHLNAQFAHLSAQITAFRAELAAAEATLKAGRNKDGTRTPDKTGLVH